jgi:hypothetical protein
MAAGYQVWSLASPNSMPKIRMDADFRQRKRLQWKYFLPEAKDWNGKRGAHRRWRRWACAQIFYLPAVMPEMP